MDISHIVVTRLTEAVLSSQLSALEQRYGMTSDEFLLRFNLGELGDDLEYLRWAGLLRIRSKSTEHARTNTQ
ncbi:MAG: hypothetical protein ACYDCQ_00855 [Dehalococcoidia bacterium]